MLDWVRLGPAAALPKGQAVRANIDDASIALFHLEDGFYAIEDTCLHIGGPLSEGRVDGCIVTCPWHGWQYDLSSGTRLDKEGSATRTYPVEVRDDWIVVGL